ncbi:MAG: hypothetical protein K0R57_3955 [Paenibacillaceae bacterium]|jgi:uncharacterized protein YrrD|nr:hypothetical protein [Paenibacillaceae bacterium]
MRSARDLIGLPVLDIVTGKRVGTVKDFLISQAWHMHGIVLDYKSWFGAARYVGWGCICSAGSDALIINSKVSIKKFKEIPGTYYLCSGKSKLTGLPLISAEGIQMGHLEDVYFSPKMEDSIVGLELSDGLLTDLQEGRRRIPVPAGARRGEDAITVPALPAGGA